MHVAVGKTWSSKNSNYNQSTGSSEWFAAASTNTTNKSNYNHKTWISVQTTSRITEKYILKAMHNKSTGVFCIIFFLSACCCKIHNTGAIWLYKSTRWNIIAAVINTITQDFNLEVHVHKHADFPWLWYLNNPSHPLPLFPYTTQKQKHILPGWGKA